MTLALSGVFQSSSLVHSLAENGQCDLQDFERCLLSLINTNPQSDKDLFGRVEEMLSGLTCLRDFCRTQNSNLYISRYAIQMIQLHKLLKKKPEVQQKVQVGLEHANKQFELYGAEDENLIRNIAQLYQKTLSGLGFRIQVQGKHQYLQQELIAARVRVLLFAGVRFAHLWRQYQGHAHHLFTARRTIGAQASSLLG